MSKKSALILVGSGHQESRSFKIGEIISEFLENKNYSVNLIDIVKEDIKECLGCEYCKAHQDECIIKDSMSSIYQLIKKVDLLVFISPVYFSNIPAMLKKVIDRCQLFYNLKDKKIIKEKDFLGIHLGGAPEYKDQFIAFEKTYNVLLPDIKAKSNGLIKITNTDKNDPILDKNVFKKIKAKINEI